MTCSFNQNQVPALNFLLYYSTISAAALSGLRQTGSTVELVLNRHAVENVMRSKTLFRTSTHLAGKKTSVRFSRVIDFYITGSSPMFAHPVEYLELLNPGFMRLVTLTGPVLYFKVTEGFEIQLTDLEDDLSAGRYCPGKPGFTRGEWKRYLEKYNYRSIQSIREECEMSLRP